MNHDCLGTRLILGTIFTIACSAPAHAQNFVQNGNKLPDARFVDRAPLRVQLVDPSPIVTDTRHARNTTQYMINVPPIPEGTNQVIQIGGGSAGGGNTRGGNSAIPITRNGLPDAGLQSNIPAQGPTLARNLPPGMSTSGLKTVAAQRLASQHSVPGGGGLGHSLNPSRVAKTPVTETYGDTSSAHAGGTQHVQVDVSGKIKPGSLLK